MLQASGRLTTNLCFEEQGATYEGSCRSIWYPMCDKFTLEPDGTCNVETAGDAKIQFYSSDIDTMIWNYVLDDNGECTKQEMIAPDIYEQNTNKRASQGYCGFKFQLINRSEVADYDFTVFRAGAGSLALSLAAMGLMTSVI